MRIDTPQGFIARGLRHRVSTSPGGWRNTEDVANHGLTNAFGRTLTQLSFVICRVLFGALSMNTLNYGTSANFCAALTFSN
jgi:hypothetical protein